MVSVHKMKGRFRVEGVVSDMWRHALLDATEVAHHPRDVTVVNHIASSQHQEFGDGRKKAVAGLVNCEHNSAVAGERHLRQNLEDVQCGGAVQARCGLIQEQHCWVVDQIHSYRHPPFFST